NNQRNHWLFRQKGLIQGLAEQISHVFTGYFRSGTPNRANKPFFTGYSKFKYHKPTIRQPAGNESIS
ncbi:MAG: hypothetical protein J7639_28285, partial [Paenibacillaceae bacterium]|nr:hypothetical protein [Paenibacillaceae bacterium]